MRRLVALVAAVAMVFVAALIRQHLGDDRSASRHADVLRLRCATELTDVCNRLAADDPSIEVSVRDDGDTVAALTRKESSADFDAWLSVGPWAGIVEDDRRQAGLDTPVIAAPSVAVGRSPVTFVGPTDRVEALRSHCGGTVTWSCVGDASGRAWDELGGPRTWGTFKVGLTPPNTGAGLVALDQAVADRVGTADWGTTDLDDASTWLNGLVTGSVATADPLQVLLTRPGSFSLAAPLESQSGPTLQDPARRRSTSLIYPDPMVTADVSLVPAAGRRSTDLLGRLGPKQLSTALARSGWRVDGHGLPGGAGLASPGALQALRNQWDQMR